MIFGKWDFFRQKHVEDQAYRFLLFSVEHTEHEMDRLSAVARGENPKPSVSTREVMHRHDIYEGMLVRSTMFRTDEADKWAEVIRQDANLRASAEKEIFRLRGEAQESVKYWDGALDDLHGRKHGSISLVSGNPEEDETWDRFDELWRYERALALDEGKPLLNADEFMGQMVKRSAQKLGIDLKKQRKHRFKHTSSTKTQRSRSHSLTGDD
jgi:hypothetical protein